MESKLQPMERRWSGLALSQVLALAYLALCQGWLAHEVAIPLLTHRVTASLGMEGDLGSVLTWQLAYFGGALLLLHALLGLVAFALARITEDAFPCVVLARRGWLVAGWFVFLVGIVMAANTTWYPSSVFSGEDSAWRYPVISWRPVQLIVGTALLLVLWLVWRAAPRWRISRPAPLIAAAAVSLALGSALLPTRNLVASAPGMAADAPHVVIIGIDSLRNDLMIPLRGPADTPNIANFLGGARRFNDAITPLARTYPSWMSILTGRHPATTNARYNLMPRRLVDEGETLADALRRYGYRAVYATDEVRFANIDGTFGFDQLITPPMGAVDFLLGYAGDVPLVNLLCSTRLGGLLFPSSHANRAAYVTYRPRQFTGRLQRELDVSDPSLLAIHLTLAHWPYAWAGMPIPAQLEKHRDSYGAAIAEVDRQFGEVMRLLADNKVLDNAIVVLLSDHGEAMGADGDSMRDPSGNRDQWNSNWGHGTSVMSPSQYQVLLALRSYGRAKLPGVKRDYEWPVSLEDLRPTLEEIATGLAPTDVDGVSLLPYMANPARADALATRVRFTETDFNVPSTLAGQYDTSGIIAESAVYYELDRDSGWMQLRANRLPELIARKQRAALSSNSLLAVIPGTARSGPLYLHADRHGPVVRVFEGTPDPQRDPEAWRLWDALKARFPGELPADSETPRM